MACMSFYSSLFIASFSHFFHLSFTIPSLSQSISLDFSFSLTRYFEKVLRLKVCFVLSSISGRSGHIVIRKDNSEKMTNWQSNICVDFRVYIYIYIYVCVCVCVCVWLYLPTPPLGQDMTQGQFLMGDKQVWIQSFPSPRLVASPRLKKPVCPTIYP